MNEIRELLHFKNNELTHQLAPVNRPSQEKDVVATPANCTDLLLSDREVVYGNNITAFKALSFSGNSSWTQRSIQQTAGLYTKKELAIEAFKHITEAIEKCGNTTGSASWFGGSAIEFQISVGELSEWSANWDEEEIGQAGSDTHKQHAVFTINNTLIEVVASNLPSDSDTLIKQKIINKLNR